MFCSGFNAAYSNLSDNLIQCIVMFIETINDCLDIKMKPDERLKTYADSKIHINRRCFLKRKSTHWSNMINYSALVLLLQLHHHSIMSCMCCILTVLPMYNFLTAIDNNTLPQFTIIKNNVAACGFYRDPFRKVYFIFPNTQTLKWYSNKVLSIKRYGDKWNFVEVHSEKNGMDTGLMKTWFNNIFLLTLLNVVNNVYSIISPELAHEQSGVTILNNLVNNIEQYLRAAKHCPLLSNCSLLCSFKTNLGLQWITVKSIAAIFLLWSISNIACMHVVC